VVIGRWCGRHLAVAALLLSLGSARAHGETLVSRLDAVLATPALRGARVAALVVDAADGRVLFARDPDLALAPASNQKRLTALAVLSTLGPAHRFVTRALADRTPDAEGGVETLALQGGGDPGLGTEEWGRFAAALARTGLRHVRGSLLLDASVLDAQRWHPSWGAVPDRGYLGPVAGLSANSGAYQVYVSPGAEPGAAPRVEIDPVVPYLSVVVRAVTVAAGEPAVLGVESQPGPGRETVVVTGTIAADASTERISRCVSDVVSFAGAVARRQLGLAGITVDGPTRIGEAPADSVPLLAFEGPALSEIVGLLLKHSNNTMAETLIKDLGARSGSQGSWRLGVAALRDALVARGIDVDGLVLVDGSGLSRQDRGTPRALVGALRVAAQDFSLGPELRAALPIAGRDGTLRSRFKEGAAPVRAKNGHLDGVVALSGYAQGPDASDRIFSLVLNGVRGDPAEAMAAADHFATVLTRP
jgi:D-alanyl-D-alanine carboxypeptidase/D-alanyl-D-alanine-endopeptidase (penicillin-binding protein 4)